MRLSARRANDSRLPPGGTGGMDVDNGGVDITNHVYVTLKNLRNF